MKILLFIVLTFSISNISFAVDEENFIYKTIISKFHSSVEKYNKERKDRYPEIVFDKNENYKIEFKQFKIHFTITDVLNNQLWANNKRFKWTSILNIKKSNDVNRKSVFNNFFDKFINVAHAGVEDTELQDFQALNLDANSTKVLIHALGDFTKNLESITTISFDPCISNSCITQRRARNIDKLYQTAAAKLVECSEARDLQTEGIDRAHSYNQGDWLTSINDYEFRSVKGFFDRLSKKNIKDAESFIQSTTNFKEKGYTNCMGVLLSGTLGDSLASNFGMGVSAMGAMGAGSLVKVELINNAGKVCGKFQELRDCLKEVKDNVSRINTMKRSIKKSDGTTMPMDSVPSNSVTK